MENCFADPYIFRQEFDQVNCDLVSVISEYSVQHNFMWWCSDNSYYGYFLAL